MTFLIVTVAWAAHTRYGVRQGLFPGQDTPLCLPPVCAGPGLARWALQPACAHGTDETPVLRVPAGLALPRLSRGRPPAGVLALSPHLGICMQHPQLRPQGLG